MCQVAYKLRVGDRPASQDIVRVYRDTFPFTFVIQDAAGVPVDVTGATFSLWVHPSAAPGGGGGGYRLCLVGTVADGPAGKVRFDPMGHVPPGRYFYDVRMVDASTAVRVIIRGQWTIEQRITRG